MRPEFFDDMIVTLETPDEVKLWTGQFGVSLPSLQVAIHKAGNRFNDIREQLGLARIHIFPRDDRLMQRLMDRGLLQQAR